MKILCLTDLHDQRAALARILAAAGPVDIVLLGGDITNFGSGADAERIVRASQASGAKVLAVAGNCDSAIIEQRLVDLGVSLYLRGVVIDGVGFHGLSGMPPWIRSMYHFTEPELAEALQTGLAQIAGAAKHVVLSHPPPLGQFVDRTRRGQHVGSSALRTFIDQTQPLLVFCGHIHEARGVEQIGRTTVVNCGPAAQGAYCLAQLDDELVVELREA
jgi:uncharacterized protein